MPKVTINGQTYEAEKGKTIIQVADEVGVQIPRYCYHPDIGIEGSCRMCLVEVKGAPKLVPSCATPIADNMEVRTNTERVHQAVRYAMEFLLLHHPIDCPVCDQSGECWLQDYYMAHAGHDSRYPLGQKTRRKKAFNLGPLVKLDQERCILCTRCVRFTRNVTKTNEIQVFSRGHNAEIGIFEDRPLNNAYSANVVDVCPVGALTSADFRFKVRVWFLKGTPSVCAGCSTGCNNRVDHSARAQGGGIPGYTATDGKIYRTVGRRNVDVNKSWLCDEGRLSFHTLDRWPRLRHALKAGEQKPVDDLLPSIHERFESIRKQYGDNAVAALGSANNTNEALFLLKQYFGGHADFRLSNEVDLYQQRQDDLLRRLDKHANTHGALDLGLNGELGGLRGLRERAAKKEIRAMWIAFHPQLVGEDAPEIIDELRKLISALEFSVVSTTHDFEWARAASVLLPMASWAEEKGTYTNYAGRVQITSRAVMPPEDAQPLHLMMAELLQLSGRNVPRDPSAIFDAIAAQVPRYAGLNYDNIGVLGVMPVEAPQEVLR
ncbi:MAG TPA: 2Fe-2S iron-sulfur cluster-binding protein [Terriglobia bacterium]|nr:2Fe-2S iron-sulfur cluster-binding protein [Terriglobia bacterium]